eukprot:TRINITY_DN3906_c0_g1_i1.p3 TRINITY_DN3906_c0_g1~~TRINITY_DN3906_c0_g1_i1.p3  ORF type:complete len:269 (-),score=74.05 TRINITY_DN3906_c0_g1_i1:1728-2414(-)
MTAAPSKIVLTYFDLEGVAEKIRIAFKLGGIAFEDRRVSFDQWPALKATAPYGQLPLLQIDDQPVVAQSGAMLRWAGRLANLYPTSLSEQLRVDEVIGLEEDLARVMTPSMYLARKPELFGYAADLSDEDKKTITAKLRAALVSPDGDLRRFLGYFDKLLAKNNADSAADAAAYFFVGSSPTIADCQVLPRLSHIRKGVLDGIPPSIIDEYPHLVRFEKAFRAVVAKQ